MRANFNIFRFDPENDQEPRYTRYSVEAHDTDRILDCLNKIRWEQDGTLAYRMSCGHGVCGSDAMKIDGKCALSCQKLVKDYQVETITIEPLPGFTVLKDLIVDLAPFFDKVEQVKPYLVAGAPPDKERIQSREDRSGIDEVIRCILCACCVGACPVSNENPDFLGPAPLVQAFRRIFDSRDTEFEKRLGDLDYPNGVWACENHFECTKACPKEIPVTKSINQMKREVKTLKE
jgi:succinate dehydrogenase / fumarate reductase iron-sulfur subunit